MVKKFFAILVLSSIISSLGAALAWAGDPASVKDAVKEYVATQGSIREVGFSDKPDVVILYWCDADGKVLEIQKVDPSLGLDFRWKVMIDGICPLNPASKGVRCVEFQFGGKIGKVIVKDGRVYLQ